jgi:hypothetical protein
LYDRRDCIRVEKRLYCMPIVLVLLPHAAKAMKHIKTDIKIFFIVLF